MNWIFFALIPPILWSISIHLDKYLLTKYFKSGGIGTLTIFSSLIGLFISFIILAIHPEVLSVNIAHGFFMFLNGILYVIALLPYFIALKKDEASITTPIFQFIPVFAFLLDWMFLDEILKINQIIGGIVIVAGAILISINLSSNTTKKIKKEVILLMSLSSFLFALNFLIFKLLALEASFWTTAFYEYLGWIATGLFLLIFFKKFRDDFFYVLRSNSINALSINGINEIINIIAKLSFNFASLLAPLTLTWIINGLEPFFIFIFGVLLTLFFPKFSKENITRNVLIQKVVSIIIMFIGLYILNFPI